MTLTPQQKKMLMIGIPAVAVLALFTVLKNKSSSSTATTTTDGSSTTAATVAGDIADFEDQVAQEIAALEAQQGQGGAQQQGTTPASPPSTGTVTNTPGSYAVNPFNVPYSPAVQLSDTGQILASAGNVWGQTPGTPVTTAPAGSPSAQGAPIPSDLIEGALPAGVSGGQLAVNGVPYYNPNGLSAEDFAFQRAS